MKSVTAELSMSSVGSMNVLKREKVGDIIITRDATLLTVLL